VTTTWGFIPALLLLPLMLETSSAALAEPSHGQQRSRDARASDVRFAYSATGPIGRPESTDAARWSFDLRLSRIAFDGRIAPAGPARVDAADDHADYDYGSTRVSYQSVPSGLEQVISIGAPDVRAKAGAAAVVSVDFFIGGGLTPVLDGYFIDLVDTTGRIALRYGPVGARDAGGTRLDAQLELVSGGDDRAAGARVAVTAVDPVYPLAIRAGVSTGAEETGGGALDQAPPGEIAGAPVSLGPGVTQTVDQIMERERLAARAPAAPLRETHHELEVELDLKEDPDAPPPMSHWPPIPETRSTAAVGSPDLPQTVGTSFRAVTTVSPSESGYIPPDTMGDVGPTQILVHVNGRIKVFDRNGVVGALNASDSTFWAAVASGISDPQVRYDRISRRWFVLAIALQSINNKIVLAVSSGPSVSGSSSFTFYSFSIGTPAPADATCFCDFPGFGVDANALYVGCNMFSCAFHTSAFVIRKSSVLSGGPMVVTGFSNIGSTGAAGPYSPRGVDNDDPGATEGYIIGTDPAFLNRINIRRVSDPGGTPTLSPTITLGVSDTNLLNQKALGSTTDVNSSDSRLFVASIHKNKITGVSSLWTAHSVETDPTCTPAGSGSGRRLGARWYEIGNLTTSPSITQFGTLCTTAAGSSTNNSERGFLYPAVVETGQGHMALGASFASATEYVGVAAAGRLRTDPPGGTRAPETIVLNGGAPYTITDPSSRNRWGDYSFTDVDPNDDQTVWTFQEYADTSSNSWSIRVVQLKAAPPPSAATAEDVVCAGGASVPLILTGIDSCPAPSCANGLCSGGGACPEYFDPGPDTGGPGYLRHISAIVSGGVTVNGIGIVPPADPANERVLTVSLSLNTTSATAGTKSVTITNPDGQAKTYSGVLTVVANRPPVANVGAFSACQGGAALLDGTASSDPDSVCGDSISAYAWDLNGDSVVDATGATPTISAAQLSSLGLGVGPHTIALEVTDSHGATNTASGTLTILADGSSCSDGNACTQTDTCQSGTCAGANPVICTASDPCHAVGLCDPGTGVCSNPAAPDGTACNDGDVSTCGDACTGAVCAGHAVAEPAEIGGSLELEQTPSGSTITWDDDPGPYGVYRGANGPAGTPWSYNHTCLQSGIVSPPVTDDDDPPPGVFFYYLITRFDECRESIPGTDGDQNPIPNAEPCSAP
jgi:hypothetical protein